ncbi:MAG TPA: Crp/Fnr family transcriptional regulator [Bacteroidales bacterium]
MKKVNPILNFFNNLFGASLTAAQGELVLNAYKKESFKKKTLIFSAGEANTRHYIIEKGLLRLYLIDPKGKEINILFAKENQIIGDLATPEPTNFYLETTEDSIVYSIDEKKLQDLMNYLSLNNQLNSNNRLRRSYIFIQQRLVSILSKPAEENYLDFQQKHPDLLQRLPQYHIASYLGISPEFLSKIIAKTTKKN